MLSRRRLLRSAVASAALAATRALPARAASAPGITDKEIKIGQTEPYSGPASAYGAIAKAELAYFKKVNDGGGVNGRMIKLLSLDDGYSPPKTVAQTRRLVEQEQAAFIFQTLGTANNTAIQKYLNDRKIPQLFVSTGAAKWDDPRSFPWIMGWQPNYQTEARIHAKYILASKPDAKIGVLYQNDDYGKDYLIGLKDGLAGKAMTMIVSEVSYEISNPTIDSQIFSLQASGADVFLNATTPKFAAQAIRRAYDIGWRPLQFLNIVSIAVGSVLTPAGLEKSVGILNADYRKDPSDPRWKDDAGYKEWLAFMKAYMPDADLGDNFYPYGMMVAMTLVQVLKQCGNDLSRENIMRQAADIGDLELPMLLPGIKVNTSPDNYQPIRQMQLQRFNGKSWELFGALISG